MAYGDDKTASGIPNSLRPASLHTNTVANSTQAETRLISPSTKSPAKKQILKITKGMVKKKTGDAV